MQSVSGCLASVALIFSVFLGKKIITNVIPILILQHVISMIAPGSITLLFQPCFFKWNQRVDQKFKWIRVHFFRSFWWKGIQTIFCIALTSRIVSAQIAKV
jgi:hypothetical protein